MRIRLVPVMVVALAIAGLAVSSASAQGMSEQKKGLWGKAHDADGKPVIGLKIKLAERPDFAASLDVMTTERGFVYPKLATDKPTEYYLKVDSTEWYIRKFLIQTRRLSGEIWQRDGEGAVLTPDTQDRLPKVLYRGGNAIVELELARIAEYKRPASALPEVSKLQKDVGIDREVQELRAMGNLKGAVDKLREVVVANPADGERRWQLAFVLAEAGESVEAIKEGQKAIAIKPDMKNVRPTLAQWLNEVGRSDQAIALLEQERDLDPANPNVYRALALLLRDAGRTDEAVAAVTKWSELAPDDTEAMLTLAQMKAAKNDFAGAEELYRKAAEKDPANAYNMFYKVGVAIWNRKGDVNAAIAAFTKSVELKPDFPKSRQMLGSCLLNQGKLAEARVQLEKFVELAPDDPEAAEIKKLIASLPKK